MGILRYQVYWLSCKVNIPYIYNYVNGCNLGCFVEPPGPAPNCIQKETAMLIVNGTVHPIDAPDIPNGFVDVREGKIWRVGFMEQFQTRHSSKKVNKYVKIVQYP